MTSKATFYRIVKEMMADRDFMLGVKNDRTDDSFEERGFNYDITKSSYKDQRPFYVINRATAPYKYDDSMIFDKGICKQSVYVDMENYKRVLSSYKKKQSQQTACRLCYNADKKENCNFSFNVNKHNKMKKHIKNVQVYVDAIMDATKLNNDMCNLIMSYL
jgi:hypothetical protein